MIEESHNSNQMPVTKEEENRSAEGSPADEKSAKKPVKHKEQTKNQLKQALEEFQSQAEKYKTQLAYVQANHENYVKAMERREANLRLQANRELIQTLLPILDDLERAQLMVPQIEVNESFIKGFTMLVENLKSALANAGVKLIECEGEAFDPLRHEVVVREESTTVPPNTVIEELRKGYLLKGALLRPSMVKIAVAPAPAPKAETKKEKAKDSADTLSTKR